MFIGGAANMLNLDKRVILLIWTGNIPCETRTDQLAIY